MSRSFSDFDVSLPVNQAGMRWHVRENEDGSTTIGCEQDVQPILDYNQALAAENDGWSKDKSIRRLGAIPFVMLEDWKNMGVDWRDPEGAKYVIKALNSNENYKLRTAHYTA